jgi:hypothetical protein
MPANQFAEVRIRCYSDVPEGDVVVAIRGKEIILTCPDYDQAVKWARVECRSYGVASVTVEDDEPDRGTGREDHRKLPLQLRKDSPG